MIESRVPLAHLAALTDTNGVFEHAEFERPRTDHGYCLDDAARALIVAAREDHSPESARIAAVCFAFDCWGFSLTSRPGTVGCR
ncbi:hypothetical protein [Microbacterium pumilum]|uniref:Uncharacterized protein n=1 Tax=Microbacterium pumilum TaxID=344165 RepID=A0ABP5D9C3_9MICO